jgi:hypothetical protein
VISTGFDLIQDQACPGEAALDEAGPAPDLLQAVPDDLDQVGETGQRPALSTDQMPSRD